MAALTRFIVGMRQEAVKEAKRPAPGAGEMRDYSQAAGTLQQGRAVDVPRPGSRFTDEELCNRFGVPMRGGIRVSRENKCIVLVDLASDYTAYTNTDGGSVVEYMGQNHYGDRKSDQVMDGNNLALSRSKEDGYTVLYFTKQDDVLVFDRIVEYDSHCIEDEKGAGGRRVILFKLRAVCIEAAVRRRATDVGVPCVAEGGATLRGGPDLDMVETVECAVSMQRSYGSKDRLLRALPESIDEGHLDIVLGYLEHSGKIAVQGDAIRWTFRPGGSDADGLGNSRGHDAALANKSILAGTRFEYMEEGKLPTETVGEYIVRVHNADEPGTYTAEDAKRLDEKMRRRARGEYHTGERMLKELGS